MAYSDDIAALAGGADHHWKFDGDSIDAIGAIVRTDTGMVFTGAALTKDATNSARMDARGDRVSLATTTTLNNGAQEEKHLGGWFMADSVELPFCRIYGEGDNTTNYQFVLLPGNFLTLEVRETTNFQVQCYSDFALEADRVYHVFAGFSGDGGSDYVKLWIDGVEQSAAVPANKSHAEVSLAARGIGEFGDPAGTVGLNGTALLMQSPGDNRAAEQIVNAYYQHWCAWEVEVTPTQIRETLFERGALADVTISSGTEGAMQTALDVYADTVRGNAPCCIEIEAVSGGGDFELNLDNITFNSLASIHVRYNGTADELTIRNTNGANCSIVSAPFGGTVNLVTEVTVQVTVKKASDSSNIENARVYMVADTGGPLTAGTVIVDKVLTNASGVVSVTFDYSDDQPVVATVRKAGASPRMITALPSGTILASGLDQTVLMAPDE